MTPASRYLEHLPALYAGDPLLGAFLLAFERVLSGLPDDSADALPGQPAIEAQIASLVDTVSPDVARRELLPWLASWFAMSLHPLWTEAQRRALLGEAAWLFARRGTALGMNRALEILFGQGKVTVENAPELPFTFRVKVKVAAGGAGVAHRTRELDILARDLIERMRPAGVRYTYTLTLPAMVIYSDPTTPTIQVGVTTLLGSERP